MKRFLYALVIIFIVGFIGILNVEAAASFGKITGGNVKDKSFKIPITGANGLIFTYDTSKLSCGGENTAIYDKDGVKGRLISNDSVEVSCTILYDKYDVLNLTLVDVHKNKDSVGMTYEINPDKKTTTTSSTTTTTKTTTTTAAKSNNANLKSLEIKVAEKIKSEDKTITTTTKTTTNSNTKTTTTKKASESTTEVIELVRYTPEFNAGVYEYTATVSSVVKKVTINATMEDTKANMVISDNASNELKAGENNKITITVTAENGSKKAYVINIKREALNSDATLKGLTIEEDNEFKFETDKYSYRVNIPTKINSLTIGYELSDKTSTIKITGNENLENGSKIKILVTAQDGTKKEYILNILKEEITTTKMVQNVPAEKNPLIIMGLSLVAFGLLGGIIYVIKK